MAIPSTEAHVSATPIARGNTKAVDVNKKGTKKREKMLRVSAGHFQSFNKEKAANTTMKLGSSSGMACRPGGSSLGSKWAAVLSKHCARSQQPQTNPLPY